MSDRYKMFTLLLIALNLWHCCVYPINGQSATNLVLGKSYLCPTVPNPKIQLSIVPKTFNPGRQIFDITLITPIPLGDELRFGIGVDMEIKLAGKQNWQRLFYVEDDFCRTIQVYIGEMAYELETAMGIPRGACPVARGRYHAVNYTMDFSKFKLQTFPFGKLRGIATLLEKPKKNMIMCILLAITSAV